MRRRQETRGTRQKTRRQMEVEVMVGVKLCGWVGMYLGTPYTPYTPHILVSSLSCDMYRRTS